MIIMKFIKKILKQKSPRVLCNFFKIQKIGLNLSNITHIKLIRGF